MHDPTIRRQRAPMTPPASPRDRFGLDEVLARRSPRLTLLLAADATAKAGR